MSEEQDAELADADNSAESDEEEPAPADEEESTDGIQEGDFIKLKYTIWSVENDALVDTTQEEIAEEEGIETEDRSFGPRTVVVGAGHVFEVVEDDLIGKHVGDTGEVTIAPAEAFGEHDPEQVRTVSADRIPEDDRYPGGHVDIDGQHGHVETIIGGRARVDFNHPLAGQELRYEYEILDTVEDRIERANGLLGMYVDVDLEMWVQTDEVEESVPSEADEEAADEDVETEEATETEIVEKETLYIESVPQLAMNQQWMFSKQQIAEELIDRLGVDRVIVQETLEGAGGLGGLGGLGMEDLEASLDEEDIDAEELVDELDAETDLDPDELTEE